MLSSIQTVRVAASSTRTCLVQGISSLKPVRQSVAVQGKRYSVKASAADSPNPARAVITGIVQGIYQATAGVSQTEPGLSPLWAGVKKLNLSMVQSAIQGGANLNEVDANGDTALLYIARAGHYKFKPSEIPAALLKAGANKEAKDSKGLTALQVSLLAGWQNISELLLKEKADTSGVPAINSRITCPDCKRIIAQYKLA
ncbi:MAG: hypothetical protein WDW38_003716 [Sanguina aurantia]